MTDLDDCFADGKLQAVPPSDEKAMESLKTARAYLQEAQQVTQIGSYRLATNGVYMAWFHAARAILFRDGIREKNHFCIEQYLRTYVPSGKLDSKWIILLARIRTRRNQNQYSFEVPASKEEIEGLLELAEQFIGTIEDLLKNP